MKRAFRLLALSLAIAMVLPACRGTNDTASADAKRCTRCAAAFLRRKMHGRRHGYGR